MTLLLAAATVPASGWAAFSFAPSTDFPAGDNPVAAAVGDFNGDEKPDLAVADANSGSVSILGGDGLGSFSAPTGFPARTGTDSPYSVAVGDFNNDAKQDLAVADLYGLLSYSNVETFSSALLGDGNGNLGAAMPFLVASGLGYPYKVVVGDLNGDPHQDLLVAGSTLVSRLLGDGSGAFPDRSVVFGGTDVRSIALADFNGDGNQDYATARSDREDFTGEVTVALGDGTGSFSTSFSSNAGTGATSVVAADLNGDRREDLAVASYGSDDVSIFLGTGSGSFGAAQTFAAGDGPRSIVAADLDGDGDVDLATTNAETSSIALLPGAGNGTFGGPTDLQAAAMSTLSASTLFGDGGRLLVGDLNCDGARDLVAVGNQADVVSVLINAQGATRPPGCTNGVLGSAAAKNTQRQKGSKIVVKVKVRANENLTATAKGKIKVNPTYKLKPKTVEVASGKSKTLKLKPKRKAQARKIAKALDQGDKAIAKLTVKLTGPAGKSTTEKLTVKLKR